MDTLIAHGMWPAAAALIALVGLGMFRTPLTALIYRTRKIGAGDKAIDFEATTERQQLQVEAVTQQPSKLDNDPLGPPSPQIAEIERHVTERISAFNDPDDATRIRRLVRGFSIMALQKEFEVIYRLIFGSQLDLLLHANAGGIDLAAADAIFENAKALYPAVHGSTSCNQWLAYPLNIRLVERRDGDRIHATQRGQEFMHYLIESGLTNPKNNG
jgi:hypothetical protein